MVGIPVLLGTHLLGAGGGAWRRSQQVMNKHNLRCAFSKVRWAQFANASEKRTQWVPRSGGAHHKKHPTYTQQSHRCSTPGFWKCAEVSIPAHARVWRVVRAAVCMRKAERRGCAAGGCFLKRVPAYQSQILGPFATDMHQLALRGLQRVSRGHPWRI